MGILADHCRYAERVALRHGYVFEILDGGDGYLFRISNDGRSFVAGAGALASYPQNGAFGASAARDKVFTNQLLERAGIANLGGRAFFITTESKKLRGQGHELVDAKNYFSALGNEAFCKPLTGSRGDFAEFVRGPSALEDYLERVAIRHSAIVIQPFVVGDESRVFVMDGEAVFCIDKKPVDIVGDGSSNLGTLIARLNEKSTGGGISQHSKHQMAWRANGYVVETEYVPQKGERLALLGRKNLAAGASISLREPLPEAETRIAVAAAAALDLRVAAVDLVVCADGTIRVIEVNSNPEIHGLEQLGRWDLIEHIWLSTIRASLK